ncbi:bifunctional diguanylate cyclase/phosphodiesterase [Butyrivibrio sp. AE2032]|uniref:bifunctional diguanylate cyclase/phosphodiesterase n=1 Tax=Butyrivibrio sp. AE2032 TaxID=1458463 RepID=UPI00055545D1|nr:GGDEF domain-containing protein [Butyrivibrio sp. AE2032]
MESKSRERTELEQYFIDNLDRAMEQQWIKAFHQPLIRAASGRVSDEEAYARWMDPDKGTFEASEFIPVLEEEGLTYKLDLYMVERVLDKMKGQREHGLFVVPESVNLSRSDFYCCDMVSEVVKRIDASGFTRDKMSIEISEKDITSDVEFMKKQVENFRSEGVKVWMDDYGSGNASMLILLQIAFDALKLDSIFVHQIEKSEAGRIIVTELIKTAVSLGMVTVAEGVETKEQVNLLKEVGCNKLQGYYYIKPVSLAEIIQRNVQGIQIGFENPDEAEYFEKIGSLNLYDLSISRNDKKNLGNYFDTMPMAIFAMDEDKVTIVRSNKSFREFASVNFPRYVENKEIPYDQIPKGTGYYSFNAVRQCAKEGKRKIIDDRTADGRILQLFMRRIATNPVTGTNAVALAILSISESAADEGLNYNYIARALSEDYIKLFFVDMDTGVYTEYTPDGANCDIKLTKHGTDYFDLERSEFDVPIYEEDLETFKKALTRKNIQSQIKKTGVFSFVTRAMIEGDPVFVCIKAVKVRGDGNFIIIGINNVDEQMKGRETVERAKEERLIYSRVGALTGNFIYLYTVDPETDHYNKYNPGNIISDMAIEDEGDDYFNKVIERAPKGLYEDDVDSFLSAFTKEKVLKEIKRSGMFVNEHRLMIDGEPRYVSLRAKLLDEEGKTNLIVGILDIDQQIRREQEYAMNLNAAEIKANIDELTKVKNKHAYSEAEKRMDENIKENPNLEFAIAVFDLNGLKEVNDTLGHQAGDKFIIKGCNIICRIFKHSPVYRVGGDEFVAVVQGYDYINLAALMDKLQKHNEKNKLKGDVVIAAGASRYQEDGRVAPVFERADEAMYKNKRELKKEAP